MRATGLNAGATAIEYLGSAAVLWTSIALWSDDRVTAAERAGLAVALLGVALPFVLRPIVQRRAANLVAAAVFGACALATYEIGGVAFLIGSFFMLVAALSTTRPAAPNRRRIATAAMIVAVPMFGLGVVSMSAGVVLAPIALALFGWALWFRRTA